MVINLENINNERALHKLLAEKFEFPEFYGNNWDAFWDSITGIVEIPKEIELAGSNTLKEQLPDSYRKLKGCFDDLLTCFPDRKYLITWS